MWCYLCSIWANLCFSCIWAHVTLKLRSAIALPETKEVRHFLPSVHSGRALCFSNQRGYREIVWKNKQYKNKKPRKTKTDRREAGFSPELNARRGHVSRGVAAALCFSFGDVMWLKGTGTKKKKEREILIKVLLGIFSCLLSACVCLECIRFGTF